MYFVWCELCVSALLSFGHVMAQEHHGQSGSLDINNVFTIQHCPETFQKYKNLKNIVRKSWLWRTLGSQFLPLMKCR